jgi:anti-anti-sigma factor
MSDPAAKPVYLVDADSDPVAVRIEGRASFQNSSCLRDFITEMLNRGRTHFVLDFRHCASMDSTFLGLLAGAALELKRKAPAGSLVLANVGSRNLDLIRSLGLHRLLTVDSGARPVDIEKCDTALECGEHSELEQARLVLQAHKNLVAADGSNRGKFQDVMAFLKNRVAQK